MTVITSRDRKTGRILAVARGGECSIPDCTRPHYARTWCKAHYWRWSKHGDPLGGNHDSRPRHIAPEEWVQRYVNITDTCWLWTGATSAAGYGTYQVDGKHVSAHRYFYELSFGPIPKGFQIDHLCRTRNCVAVKHMEVVTQRENILRGEGPSAQQARQTHCKRGHEFTEENTYHQPSRPNSRRCRACEARKAAGIK